MKLFFLNTVAPRLGAAIIRLIGMSLRIRLTPGTRERLAALQVPGRPPVIMALWHNRLFLSPFVYRKYWRQHSVVALTSRSRDGQMIANILKCFRMKLARGSTSRKGSEAFRELLRKVREDHFDVAMTPDGPRGPRYHVYPGVLALSQRTGCPIIPYTCHLHWKKTLRSWDGFQIPLPFSVCEIHFGDPIQVPSDATAADLEDYARRLTAALGV
jgi:lysophospholipid acyltransferase (LPLAT)-like uncharacterized protein